MWTMGVKIGLIIIYIIIYLIIIYNITIKIPFLLHVRRGAAQHNLLLLKNVLMY